MICPQVGREPPLWSSMTLSSTVASAKIGLFARCVRRRGAVLAGQAAGAHVRLKTSAPRAYCHCTRAGRNPLADNPGKVEDLAVAFYKLNEDPKESPNLLVEEGDDYSFLMDLLDDKRVLTDCDLALALLRVMKVLTVTKEPWVL